MNKEKTKKVKKTETGSTPDIIDVAPETNVTVKEAKESTAVFAFGRMNPPTTGHEKLIHKVAEVAIEHGGQAHVVASHSQNTNRDPLPQDKKIEYLKKIAPKGVHVHGSSKEEPSFLHQAKRLHDAGHQHLVMVAGSDRVDEYKKKLDQYNGKEGHYNFKSIKVVSAGHRDPDAEGAEGMSGTKMRGFARSGDHKSFKSGLPKALHPHAKQIADHIRQIGEETQKIFVEAVLDYSARRKRAILMKRREPRLQRQRMIALKRFAGNLALMRRARKVARNIVRKRFAGKRGADYTKLSTGDKIAVDKQVQGKQGLVNTLAKRLLQKVRRKEAARLTKMRAGIARSKTANINLATSFVPTLPFNIFENIYKKVVESQYKITEKELNYITEKSIESDIPIETLLEVFYRGVIDWSNKEDTSHSATQWGFNRLNSFISGGKALEEDIDLYEGRKADIVRSADIIITPSGKKMPAREIVFKKKYDDKEETKEGLKDPKDNPCWDGYKPVGTKKKNGKVVPNCVPEEVVVENASTHLKAAQAAQAKGLYQKAALHRRIASALMRKDSTTAQGLMKQVRDMAEEEVKEASYVGNIGAMEMFKFHQKASSEEKKKLQSHIQQKQTKKAWDLVQKVTKTKLHKSVYEKQEFRSKAGAGEEGTDELVKKYKKDTPGQIDESFVIDRSVGMGVTYYAKDLGIKTQGGFQYHPSVEEVLQADENFMDGRNPEDKGDMARHGLKGKSISQLKKIRSSDSASPRKKQLAHWYINMHKKD